MGTTLTGTTPQDTYDSLIKVTDNGPLSGTAKYLSDGLGNDSILALSTARVGIGETSPTATLNIKSTASNNSDNLAQVLTNSEFRLQYRADDVSSLYIGGLGSERGFLQGVNGAQNAGADISLNPYGGNVGIGTSSPDTKLEIQSTSSAGASLKLSYDTLPSGTVTTNDVLGQVLFEGLDASNGGTVSGVYGRISSIADGLWNGSANRGADLTFSTAQYNGTSVVLSERLRILAGGGLTFNGDTAAANALNDYEEGTFTPTFNGTTRTGGTLLARYTKIGRLVHYDIFLFGATFSGSSGPASIGGFPFTSNALVYGQGLISYNNCVDGNTNGGYVDAGATTFFPVDENNTTVASFIDGTGDRNLMISGSYTV